MKDQYFGDVNDYRKYGMLRLLCGEGQLKIGVCWMLTCPDQRSDGQSTNYLDKSEKWRPYDPCLFDMLRQWVRKENKRDIGLIQDSVIPGAKFFIEKIEDDISKRSEVFRQMQVGFEDVDLVFFDPDNGIEVPSKPKGRQGSSRYIYWDELIHTYQAGQSVLVYQHFPHEKRASFIERMKKEIDKNIGADEITALRTPQVVFFLIAHEKHAEALASGIKRICEIWGKDQQIFVG